MYHITKKKSKFLFILKHKQFIVLFKSLIFCVKNDKNKKVISKISFALSTLFIQTSYLRAQTKYARSLVRSLHRNQTIR